MKDKKAEEEKGDFTKRAARYSRFLGRTIRFVMRIIHERGVLLEKTVVFCGTHTHYAVRDFNGFSFSVEATQSVGGGTTVLKIWYHPTRPFCDRLKPVLEISWGIEAEKREVHSFDVSHKRWQGELQMLMEPPEEPTK